MPEFGILDLDYASARRPPSGARVLGETAFTSLLVTMQGAGSAHPHHGPAQPDSVERQLQALGMVSHYIYVSSQQLRELLGSWIEASARADCFVLVFNRVADMHNEKVFRVRFGDASELERLRQRLGHVVYFPFIQPEQAQFRLDFGLHDQRLAASILVQLAGKERGGNLRKASFVRDGKADELSMGVPRSWEVMAKLPKDGTFEGLSCLMMDRSRSPAGYRGNAGIPHPV